MSVESDNQLQASLLDEPRKNFF
jgi:MFS family permease